MEIANRTVLITGGTSGIGLGLAEAFLKANSKVIVCGRDQDKLSRVKELFPLIETLPCDVGKESQRKKLAEDVLRRFPEMDVLVNNAGVQKYIDLKKGYEELKSGEDEIAINFVAPLELTALFIKHLLNKPKSAVINISSGLAFMPMPSTPVYNATKAAIHTYSLVLRQQLKGSSVKVFEIVPPQVDTDLNKKGRESSNRKFRGISTKEYIPTVIDGLQKDIEMITHGYEDLMTKPRGETEYRLLSPSW